MKKIISCMLVIALTSCLYGCKSKTKDTTPPDSTDDVSSMLDLNETPTEIQDVETTENTTIVETESIEDTETIDVAKADEPEYFTNDYGTYRKVNEEVTTEGNVFLRSSPNGKKVVSVNMSVRLTRVGVGEENGWSIVLYKDEEAYVPTLYLSPVENAKYKEVNEVVYTTQEVNFRNGPSIRCKNLGKFLKNSALTRIGIGEDGWSKILYKDETVYIYSQYLETRTATPETESAETTVPVAETEPVEVLENTAPIETEPQDEVPFDELTRYEEDGVIYEVVDEIVEAARTVNIREKPTTKSDKVGELPGAKTIQRVGIGDNGWSKVIYKNQTAYIKSEYLLKR